MKMKSPPATFWKQHRTPAICRKQRGGICVQTAGFNAVGQLVCCGPSYPPTLSAKWVWRTYNNWVRWRRWYDNLPWNRREAYPAKHRAPVARWVAYLPESPAARIVINIPQFPRHDLVS